jgi:hypothetical protein
MRDLIRRIEPYLTPLLAFSGLFLVSLIALSLGYSALGIARHSLILNQLMSLASAIVASAICVFAIERGRWELGVLVSPQRAFRGAVRGLVVVLVLIGLTDLVILAVSDYRHVPGLGINWTLLFTLILPAAFGEELLFRGYVLQKLYRTSPGYAILVTSLLFAFAHGGNPAVGPLAFTNIFLAGVLLGLMWDYDRTLWMPTVGHFAWNALSGPVLGHELSGLDLGPTLLTEVDPGPAWITGGDFGIEASAILTIAEVIAIGIVWWRIRVREHTFADGVLAAPFDASSLPDRPSGNENIDEVSSQ